MFDLVVAGRIQVYVTTAEDREREEDSIFFYGRDCDFGYWTDASDMTLFCPTATDG